MPRRWTVFGAGLMPFVALACSSDPRAPVSGKVYSGDKLLTAGEVRFHGTDNRFASTQIRADGSYSLSDAPVGECKITVHPPAVLLGKVGPPPKGVEVPPESEDGPGRPKAQPKPSGGGPGPPGMKGAPGGLMIPDAKGSTTGSPIIKDSLVPDKYQAPDSTDIKYTVQKGENTFEIKLPR